jgi:hypothetical protein
MEMAAVRELLGEPCDVGVLGDGDIDKYGEGWLRLPALCCGERGPGVVRLADP